MKMKKNIVRFFVIMYDFRKSFSYTVYHNWSHLVSASQMGLPCAVPMGLSPTTAPTKNSNVWVLLII